jgi:uncharacterized membrane protein (DUF485 family)
MPVTFSLTASDYKLLERAVLARFQRKQGRFNSAWFAQMFAWMFVTLALITFFKQWQRAPEEAQAFGAVVLFAVVGFLFASLRPLAGQWLYNRYVAAWDHSFTKEQSIDLQNGLLILESATAKSAVPSFAIIDHTEDERNHYLFITGVQAITIPKVVGAALGTDFTAFLAEVPNEA